jgi:arginyl-tRNA synthetase
LRALEQYPEELAEATEKRAPHRVTTWVRDFAKLFHAFYRDCRVVGGDPALTQARLWLAEACRLGLASALDILGVSAPDEMTRIEDEAADREAG